ncbi:V-type immunoglobulin domain-containing suppressor of T-cell activation [Gopherus flavomarginatus]|uniref:V-set immunoregulatory receptor n=2 Tax=Gopherus TaxID=38771 RepID=A0A8C4WR67_9SAUR|nr:V-type immunoglobulin domain-containing suppressor of T-cell activation [Gopherus evgoodei]XP_050815623.1 V-type immunoglobulin domain-containing suppressor of T-cell activation [Gopherus flavomarginatus]
MDVYHSHAMDGVWKGWVLLIALYLAFYQEQITAFKITTPYSLYVCPEGQNVTLTCKISGPLSARHDLLYKIWYFSSNGDQSCSEKQHIRNVTERDLHHEPGKHHGTHSNVTERYFHGERANHHGLETTSDHHGTFHIIMMNLTLQDSGNYCCYVVETKKEHDRHNYQQVAHGFMELRIQKAREAFPNCTFHPGASKDKENITAAALATGACIVGILCLPLILILIYKQRQAVNTRRAHELVRMESNAQGIENPGFEAVPSTNTESRPKPQMTYMASRQQSESGRHLLSEPNTPLSPPGTGDCFFPTLEPVPDSPSSMKV